MSDIPVDAFTSEDGAAFVQAAPGKETHWIGNCFDAGDLPKPGRDFDPVFCLDEWRNPQVVTKTQTMPSKVTSDLTGLMDKTANWLERFADENCPFWIHFIQTKCGSKGVLSNWERIFSYYVWSVTDSPISNLMQREGGNATMRAYNWTGAPFRIDSRELVVTRQTTAETEALNAIWSCAPRCLTSCGDKIESCQHLQAGADAVALGTANVQTTTDEGATWAAAAVDPFAADENIMSGVCFAVNKNTTRWLVVRDGDAANPLEVGYSDDGGASWTNADVGVTNNEAGTGPKCLFAIDYYHIWLCTDDGNVFFSSDGGANWTDQGALAASGANPLNAIYFENANIGYAVGDTDTVIYTTDGGDTWAAGTATGSGDDLLGVQCFNGGNRVFTCTSGADFYISHDATATWATSNMGITGAGAGEIPDFDFSTEITGLLAHNTVAPLGTIYQTVDGGRSWRALTTPANSGLNAVIACGPNKGFAVGEVNAATAVILKAEG